MAEHELEAPVLGVSWDGTGYGLDGTIWGGEFLQINETSFTRAAYFRPFPLPGGEKAIKEPRRSAIGLLYTLYGDDLSSTLSYPLLETFPSHERAILQTMLANNLNTPLTSSVGRLFDAVAALVGLRDRVSFEGQAAMELEFALDGTSSDAFYAYTFQADSTAIVIDWKPMIQAILGDVQKQLSIAEISLKFHNTLVEIILDIAHRLGEQHVVLTGGCFQNKYLTERAVKRLGVEGFQPYWHHQIPPNDGGIALGQIMAASREDRRN